MKKTQAKRAGTRSSARRRPAGKKTAGKTAARTKGAARSAKSASKPSAGEDDLDIASIERLIQLMTDNDLLEIEVRNGPNRRVRLSRRPPDASPVLISNPGAQLVQGVPAPPESAAVPPAESPEAAATDGNMLEFVSPMVGTFYRAPTPESPPYVMAGDRVNGETVLCLIEAMKVMNEIKADLEGEIVDILVENGEAVEFGQPLFLIRKTG